MIDTSDLYEIKSICERLNYENRSYVLAVANALNFTQKNAQNDSCEKVNIKSHDEKT